MPFLISKGFSLSFPVLCSISIVLSCFVWAFLCLCLFCVLMYSSFPDLMGFSLSFTVLCRASPAIIWGFHLFFFVLCTVSFLFLCPV